MESEHSYSGQFGCRAHRARYRVRNVVEFQVQKNFGNIPGQFAEQRGAASRKEPASDFQYLDFVVKEPGEADSRRGIAYIQG